MKKIILGLMALATGITALAIGKKYDRKVYEAVPTSVSTKASEYGISYYRNNTVAFFRTDTVIDKKLAKSDVEIYTAKITEEGDLINAKPAKELMDLGVSGTFAYDAKKDKIYFTKYNTTNRVYQLFESTYAGNAWGAAKLVEIKGLTPFRNNTSVIQNASWDYLVKGASILHPVLGENGNRIYFSSNLKNGEGKFDIWYVDYDEENKMWGEPVNVGKGVNTTFNEQYPFALGDSILYYTTNVDGEGLYDIKVARLSQQDTLETEDMGEMFNTSANEYNLINNNKNIFFVADRGNTKDDIMYMKVKPVPPPPPPPPKPEPPKPEPPAPEPKKEFEWTAFHFEYDVSTLGAEFDGDFDKLAKTMLEFIDDYEFIVWGHADERGTDEYNMALSLRRANFVAGQLIKRGVPKWKLHIQGFGKRMPVVRNAQTEEEHAKNRRVVVDVVKR